MNFNSIFEELSSLYEEVAEEVDAAEAATEEEVVEEGCSKKLVEDAEDAEDATPEEDVSVEESEEVEEVVEDEAKQVILECSNCGAITLKIDSEVVGEDSDLVNLEDECAFCGESSGYRIMGVVAPYEVADEEIADDEEEIDIENIEDDEVVEDEEVEAE